MKRKVIQIAGSTQLISLPRQWAKKNDIKKGQELDVLEDGDKVIVRSSASSAIEKDELDITALDGMASRCIRSLYKRGIDELRVTFSNSDLLKQVQNSINKDVVGFEILEQGPTFCIIKNVSGHTEEFDSVLRRTFLLILSMTEEFLLTLKKGDYNHLKNVAFLEQANNRFTMLLRRHINKNGRVNYDKIGPLYSIVESLENVADQYKYTCQYFFQTLNSKSEFKKELIELAQKSNNMLRDFYEVFYKYDEEKIVRLKATRNAIISASLSMLKKPLSAHEIMLLHHSISASQKIFNMVGPYLTMTL